MCVNTHIQMHKYVGGCGRFEYVRSSIYVAGACIAGGRCDPVPTVSNATPNSSMAIEGSIVQYTCIEGFTSLVAMETKCDGQQWTQSQFTGCQRGLKIIQYFLFSYFYYSVRVRVTGMRTARRVLLSSELQRDPLCSGDELSSEPQTRS